MKKGNGRGKESENEDILTFRYFTRGFNKHPHKNGNISGSRFHTE